MSLAISRTHVWRLPFIPSPNEFVFQPAADEAILFAGNSLLYVCDSGPLLNKVLHFYIQYLCIIITIIFTA